MMITLKNGATLVHDYADINFRCVIGQQDDQYVCWYMDTDGNAFGGACFPYVEGDYPRMRALLRAVVCWSNRIDDAHAFTG